MPRDLEQLYSDVPEPKHVWVTERESRAPAPSIEADMAWDDFLAASPPAAGHVLQSSGWARLKSEFGWQTERAILRTIPSPDAPILGGASILYRRLPWGQSLAYAPKGPAVDWGDEEQVRAVLRMVQELALKRRAALVKIEPEAPASPQLVDLLQRLGWRASPQRVQPLSTIHIDLADDEDAWLARMKPKWRYNIRLAERKGVTVRAGEISDMPVIRRLLTITGARDGFGVHSAAYYQRAFELFMAPGRAAWLLAEHEGTLLGAIAVFAFGRMAWYMWGASSDEGRNRMPNHALQWAAMRWAKARGCTLYDLWGIPDEVGANPDSYTEPASWGQGGLWGVYRFKQGFGGRVVRYVGAWDLPLSRPGYRLYTLALRIRKTQVGE